MTDELVGKRLKDGRGVMHYVARSADNHYIGGADVEMTCGLRCNVIPEVSLRKQGNVDCMGCLVKAR